MMEDDSFVELLERLRRGDVAAEQLLFEKYDGPIRRAARMRTMHSRMQRFMDSEDIRQSVLRSFFQRVRGGELVISTPGHLVGLLMDMTRNKVADQVRRLTAVKRGGNEQVDAIDANHDCATDDSTPDEQIIQKEIIEMVDDCLTRDERLLIQLRQEGLDWKAIGDRFSTSSDAARKRYERMVARITSELGLEECS